MTEKTSPERAALLRREAANILGLRDFDPPGQWPEHFPPTALAALMAGGYRGERKAEYRKWLRRIEGAIAEGMEAERHETSHTTPPKQIDTWGRTVPAGGLARVVATMPGMTTTTIHFRIHRQPFAAWLRAIGERPSESVRAWLGEQWGAMEQQAPREAQPAPPPAPTLTERRVEAIVKTARCLGYDPAKVAWGGKAKIKKECLTDAKLFTRSTFDKAWQAARKSGFVDVEGAEIYRGQ